jgi:amino acid permease
VSYGLGHCQRTGCHSYVSLVSHAFGPRLRDFTLFSIMTLQFGTLVASVNDLADIWASVATSVMASMPPEPGGGMGSNGGASTHRNVVMTAGVLLGVLPVAILVPNTSVLAPVSALVVAFLVAFTVFTGYCAAFPEPVFAADPMIIGGDSDGVVMALPILFFAFGAHTTLFPVFNSLRRPKDVGWSAHVAAMAGVVRFALGVCVVLYAAVGFFGYAAFREHTSGNVINNFGGFHSTRTSFMHLFKLGYGCQVCASIPITLLPLRDNILPFILPDGTMTQPGTVGLGIGAHTTQNKPSSLGVFDEFNQVRRLVKLQRHSVNLCRAPYGCAGSGRFPAAW